MLDVRLIGDSRFVALAMGTIAKGSRTVHVRYYFTDSRAAGGTGTAGLMITANPSAPEVARVRHGRSGRKHSRRS
ncbi:hypothetical protein AB0K49_12980 [Streptomyces decoyicus]|uniref:hypothetical protein n=1 Tax=Streptomyces decoyicus TaxID=249567 RepID=UPI00345DE691